MPILIKGRGVRRLQRKKQNFIQGAFILMLASLLVKVIGAFFQIPLLNMIGGKDSPAFGMFSAAYRVYTAMLMISTVGVPAALAKMVAEATARGREHEVRRTVRVAGSVRSARSCCSSARARLHPGSRARIPGWRLWPSHRAC